MDSFHERLKIVKDTVEQIDDKVANAIDHKVPIHPLTIEDISCVLTLLVGLVEELHNGKQDVK